MKHSGYHAIHPAAVLSASLVLSLLLWLPTLQATINGDASLTTAAIRYLVGFTFVRIAVGGVVHLINHYRALADRELMNAVAAEIESQMASTTDNAA